MLVHAPLWTLTTISGVIFAVISFINSNQPKVFTGNHELKFDDLKSSFLTVGQRKLQVLPIKGNIEIHRGDSIQRLTTGVVKDIKKGDVLKILDGIASVVPTSAGMPADKVNKVSSIVMSVYSFIISFFTFLSPNTSKPLVFNKVNRVRRGYPV